MKKRIISAILLLVICSVSVFLNELRMRPSVEYFEEAFLTLPGYREAKMEIAMPETYKKAYDAGAWEILVYTAADGTAREFAIVKMKEEDSSSGAVVEVMNERVAELKNAFSYSDEESLRVGDARIVTNGKYVVMAVYDTERTAENLIHAILDH